MGKSLLWASTGTGFTFLMTTLGAALVFFFRGEIKRNIQRVFLGFAAGVMVAASVWSLLIPAIEEAEQSGIPGWLPAAGGFVLGVGFLMLMDTLMPHLHPGSVKAEGLESSWKRTTLMVLAVTLHNIPEGMAVGLSFAMAAQEGGDAVAYTSAMTLALGIGIQNFPEGAIISMPLKSEGVPKGKAFLYGMLSGIVEPMGAILMIVLSQFFVPILPYLLSFAAGAMAYVVVEELIPEGSQGTHSNIATIGFAIGFVIMMILDVALG